MTNKPKVGEVYQRGRKQRIVLARMTVADQDGILYRTPSMIYQGGWNSMEYWQRWASKAQLVERAK